MNKSVVKSEKNKKNNILLAQNSCIIYNNQIDDNYLINHLKNLCL